MRLLRDIAPIDVEVEPGFPVRLRPMKPSDTERAREAYRRLSDQSRRNRFWQNTLHLEPEMARRLTDTDDRNHVGWIALPLEDIPGIPGYGAASFWRTSPESGEAEFSITVLDEWQRRGFGALLLSILWWEAHQVGIRRFVGTALSENLPMKEWWESAGGETTPSSRHFELSLPLVDPPDFADQVEFNLHAGTVAYELAGWFRHWDERCGPDR